MAGEDFFSWSTTAASNANADSSINWSEGQPRASVNDSARSMMAAQAKQRVLRSGTITTTGSANAQAFSTGVGYTGTLPTGLRALVTAGFTNTGAMTLTVDGIGPYAVKGLRSNDMLAGQWLVATYQEIIFSGTNWISLGTGLGTQTAPQVFVSSGYGVSLNYTTPPGALYLVAELVGGGGGGGPGSPLTSTGTNGVHSYFQGGGIVLDAGAGQGAGVAHGAVGGGGSGGDLNVNGGYGNSCGMISNATVYATGGAGGASFFGGGGAGGYTGVGNAASVPGAGGGGGSSIAAEGGGGGGAGSYVRKLISLPVSSYNYYVGDPGQGGISGGGLHGAAGAPGIVMVTAFFS
jgi:hypothetical protein